MTRRDLPVYVPVDVEIMMTRQPVIRRKAPLSRDVRYGDDATIRAKRPSRVDWKSRRHCSGVESLFTGSDFLVVVRGHGGVTW